MKITFIRHSKVLFNWASFYNSEMFDLACINYDFSDIESIKKINLQGEIIYVSTLFRSEETANRILIGEVEVIKTALLNEVPLRSFVDTKIKLPTSAWMLIGRLQWLINNKRQKEIRKDSEKRISVFLDLIEQKQQDCIVVGHGFYFSQMVGIMKTRFFNGDMKKRIKNEEVRIYDLSN